MIRLYQITNPSGSGPTPSDEAGRGVRRRRFIGATTALFLSVLASLRDMVS